MTVFIRHTSASLVIFENADPSARTDLHNYFERLAPENAEYVHALEGPDDATSHLRMALTRTSEVIPIVNGQMTLGTWQGIFVFEHRKTRHNRDLTSSFSEFDSLLSARFSSALRAILPCQNPSAFRN